MNWGKRTPLGSLSLAALALALLLLASCGDPQPRSRNAYGAYDFDRDPRLNSFNQDYQGARQRGEPWVQDPIAVALRVAGYPDPDGVQPDRLSVYWTDVGAVIAIVSADDLRDDSVSAKEIRVDLVKGDGVWEVGWAGGRYRCWREIIDLGWTTAPCP